MKINKEITPYNKWAGRFGDSVEWIVMHYTGNPCTYGPDTAKGEALYFAEAYRGASAHFFVDESEVWQSVELSDTAWHCGDAASLNGCHNTNSVGIEMCVRCEGGVYSIPEETADRAAELVRYLLTLYPTAKVCRHRDVTGKTCPEPWVRDYSLYKEFLEKIKEEKMTSAEKKEFDALERRLKTVERKVKAGEDFDRKISRDVARIEDRTKAAYNRVGDCPDWLRPTVEKLVRRGILKGDGGGDLALTPDLARALVMIERAGGFGV